MSELFHRVAELGQLTQDMGAQEQQRRAKVDAENDVKRAISRRRAAEFIGIMLERRVPTMPIYQEHRRVGTGGILYLGRGTPDETLDYVRRGDGWLVRPWAHYYDEGTVPGLFLTDGNTPFTCREVTDERPDSNPPYVSARVASGEHAMVDWATTPDGRYGSPSVDELRLDTIFADDDGLSLLAEALRRHNITE